MRRLSSTNGLRADTPQPANPQPADRTATTTTPAVLSTTHIQPTGPDPHALLALRQRRLGVRCLGGPRKVLLRCRAP